MDEDLHDELLRRVEEAVRRSGEVVAESELLRDLSEAVASGRLTARCAWCGRYELGGRWVVAEHRVFAGGGIGASHGICPDCLRALRESGLSH